MSISDEKKNNKMTGMLTGLFTMSAAFTSASFSLDLPKIQRENDSIYPPAIYGASSAETKSNDYSDVESFLLGMGNKYIIVKNPLEKNVDDYIALANSENFICEYNKEIKSFDFFVEIRSEKTYRDWFDCFKKLSKNHNMAKTTMLFSLAQFNFSLIKEWEKAFVVSALNDSNKDIVYYALVTIENWDDKEYNEIAYSRKYSDSYLQFVANGLKG